MASIHAARAPTDFYPSRLTRCLLGRKFRRITGACRSSQARSISMLFQSIAFDAGSYRQAQTGLSRHCKQHCTCRRHVSSAKWYCIMNISVFGLGYVGAVCAACFADRGHTVIGVDKSEVKVDLFHGGRSPVVEAETSELISKGVKAGRLTATTDAKAAVESSEISIVCVGTPSRPNGALEVAAVEAVSTEIGQAIRAKSERHAIVLRSTVLPGTGRTRVLPRIRAASGNAAFGFAFNPEFMREGTAVADFNRPSRKVIGALDDDTADQVMSLYADFPGRHILTSIETAELVKYVDNAWHALKVTFANEIGLIAKSLDNNSDPLMDIFLADTRLNISPAYLRPGFAFGGSCLPKDLRALTYLARQLDLSLPVLDHVLPSNRMLIERAVDWVLGQSRKRVAVLGIGFKSGTDDVRESPSIELVERLLGKGREVRIFGSERSPGRLNGREQRIPQSYLATHFGSHGSRLRRCCRMGRNHRRRHPGASSHHRPRPGPPRSTVLDLARVPCGLPRYEGFLS
jgi:GDP-mannose 6-dehydrogenase